MNNKELNFAEILNAHIFNNEPKPIPDQENIQEAQLAYADYGPEKFIQGEPPIILIEAAHRWKAYGEYLDQLLSPEIDPLTAEIREVRQEDLQRGRKRSSSTKTAKAQTFTSGKTITVEEGSF